MASSWTCRAEAENSARANQFAKLIAADILRFVRTAKDKGRQAATKGGWTRWGIPSVIALTVLAVFMPVCWHDFIEWDDGINISKNPDFKPVTADNLAKYWDWHKPKYDAYLPLTYSSWGLLATVAYDPATGGMNPAVYHSFNLALHIFSSLFVFWILVSLGANRWASCAGALIFALHPLQVEPVAWATGTKDLLSGTLALCALWCYVLYARTDRDKPTARRWVLYSAGILLFGTAMLAKPTVAAMPLAAAAISILILKRGVGRTAAELFPWILVAAPIAVGASRLQPASIIKNEAVALKWRFVIALDTLAFYFGKLVLPIHLCIDYGRTPQRVLHSSAAYFTWLCPIALAILAGVFRRRLPWFGAGLIVFCAGPGPLLGIVPFAFQYFSTPADRYMYVGLLGAGIIVAFALTRWKSKLFAVCAFIVVGALAAGSMVQLRYWQNDETLFMHTMQVDPLSWVATSHVGGDLLDQGHLAEAKTDILAALKLNPDDPYSRTQLGMILVQEKDLPGAIAQYQCVLRQDPDNAEAHYNLANVFLRMNLPLEAIPHYRAAMADLSQQAGPHTNLGIALAMTAKPDEAIAELETAARLDPKNVRLRVQLGDLLASRHRYQEALEQFGEALQIDPNLNAARQRYAYLQQFLQRSASPRPQ